MKNPSLTNNLINLILCGLLFVACKSPVEPEGETAKTHAVKSIVLRSHGNNLPDFWAHLNTNWSQYGSTEVIIDYTSFGHDSINYNELLSSAADVVIIDDARNPLVNESFLDSEIAAIVQYVEDGHSLIVTGGTLRPSTVCVTEPCPAYKTEPKVVPLRRAEIPR